MQDSLEELARRYATQAHAETGQRRKYTVSPTSCIPLPLWNWSEALPIIL